MALSSTDLANKLHDALKQKSDGQGKPTKVSQQTQAYASGIIKTLKAGVVSHLVGTVTGVTAAGGPLSGGQAIGGLAVLTPAMDAVKSFVSAPKLAAEIGAVVTYIATGLVSFDPGLITGTCSSTPVNPGVLVNGAGTGGKITGLTGAGCLAAVASALGGIGPDALDHYNTLIDYILANAEVEYAAGTVQGVCPAGGGPLTGGLAAGGTIS